MKDGKIIEILCDYGLKPSDLSTAEWQQIGDQQPDGGFLVDDATMHRMARLVSVNKLLKKQKGGEPLTWTKEGCTTNTKEEENASPEEWRGDYGVVMGMGLCKVAYERLWKKCKTKKALKLRGDADASKKYLVGELQKMTTEKKKKDVKDLTMLHFKKKAREIVRAAKKV